MTRLLALGLMIGLGGLVAKGEAVPATSEMKEKLRELQEFIGQWKGTASAKARPGPRDPFWEEVIQWGWKFKGDDCWLRVEFKGGRFLKEAELRWVPEKKQFQLTGTPVAGGDRLVFLGEFKDDKLVLHRSDPRTREVQRIRMNTAAEGIRLMYYVDRRTESGTIWRLEYQLGSTRQGESLARKAIGPECIVSGGLGTSTVSYMGETFYVCCSGCRDEFHANPRKYVDAFKARKGKK